MKPTILHSLPALLALATGCSRLPVPAAPPTPVHDETRGCAAEALPADMPSPLSLLDTTSLNPALASLAAGAERARGTVTLTLWYEPDGMNIRRDVVRHTVTPTLADSVQELVFAALATAPEREAAWGLRLHVGLGEQVTYDTEPRVYCPPRARDPELENAIERPVFQGVRYRSGVRERTVLLRVTVHPMGYVAGAEVIQGAGSGGTLEQQLIDYIRQFSFEPARLDGIPVAGQIVVPLRVRA